MPTRPLEGDATADVVDRRRRVPRPLDGVAAARARDRASTFSCWRQRCAAMARAAGTAASARRSGPMPRPSATRRATPLPSPYAARLRRPCAGSAPGARRNEGRRLVSARRRCYGWRPRSRRWAPGRSRARSARARSAEEVVSLGADEVRARCDSPLLLGGARFGLNATVQPARLALGLRAKLLERGVRIHERTRGDEAPSRRRRRDTKRSRARRLRGARSQLGGGGVPGLPALARRRLEPHRPHGAHPGGARGAGLDGRRGDRRQPHARPLHADDPRRADRLRLGRRRDGVRRAGRRGGWSSTGRSSPRRARALVRFFPQLARPRA